MLADVVDIFANSQLGNVFSADGLSSFANIEFWVYWIFYILITLTIMYLLFGLYGYHRDKQDLLVAVEEELKDMEKDKDVLAI